MSLDTTGLAGGTSVPLTRNITTISPLTGGGSLATDLTLGLPAANGAADGYLTMIDWNTFNNKVDGSDLGIPGGVATLDGSGLVPSSQIPPLTITDTFVVASQAAMLALSGAETGDVAIRTDITETFILRGTDPAVLGDWEMLLSPTGAVVSVFGRTGAVGSMASDYDASQIDNDSTVPGAFVSDALDDLAAGPAARVFVYYVSPGGSDTNDGQNPDRAFQTIAAAMSAVTSNALYPAATFEVQLIGSGIYPEDVTVPEFVSLIGPSSVILGRMICEGVTKVVLSTILPNSDSAAPTLELRGTASNRGHNVTVDILGSFPGVLGDTAPALILAADSVGGGATNFQPSSVRVNQSVLSLNPSVPVLRVGNEDELSFSAEKVSGTLGIIVDEGRVFLDVKSLETTATAYDTTGPNARIYGTVGRVLAGAKDPTGAGEVFLTIGGEQNSVTSSTSRSGLLEASFTASVFGWENRSTLAESALVTCNDDGSIDLTLGLTNGALRINSDAGLSGQVFTSNGPLAPPTWETPTGGGGLTGTGVAGRLAFWDSTTNLNNDSQLLFDDTLKRLSIGSAPAQSGSLALDFDDGIFWRNSTNGADYGFLLGATDRWEFTQPVSEPNVEFTQTETNVTPGGLQWSFLNAGSGTSVVRVDGWLEAHEANGFGLVATEGAVRLRNNTSISWRNASGGQNYGLTVDGSNRWTFLQTAGDTSVDIICGNTTTTAGGVEFNFSNAGIGTAAVRAEGWVEAHEANGFGGVAQSGSFRARNNMSMSWRNSSNGADMGVRVDGSNRWSFDPRTGSNIIDFISSEATGLAGGTDFRFQDPGVGTAKVSIEGWLGIYDSNGFPGSIAQSGSIRLRNNTFIAARNVSNGADIEMLRVTTGNRIRIANQADWPATNGSGVLTNNGAGVLTWSPASGPLALNDLTGVNVPSPNVNDLLQFVGGNWVDSAPSSVAGSIAIGNLSNVSGVGPATNQVLKWTGSQWAPGNALTSVENLQVKRGTVSAAGGTISGSGYTVTKLGVGNYRVNYTSPTPTAASAACTICDGTGAANDRTIRVFNLFTTSFTIQISTTAGTPVDTAFCFVVSG